MKNKIFILLLLSFSLLVNTKNSLAAKQDHLKALETKTCIMCDLRYEDFSKKNLTAVDYSGAFLFNSNLAWSTFTGANFESAILTMAKMEWSNFDLSILAKASLEDADMFRATFRQANMRMAKLNRVNLANSVLTEANLLTASLVDASLIGANAKGTIFRNADLRRVNFTHADLTKADFQGANLTGATLNGVTTSDTLFSNAILDDIEFSYSYIRHANFRSAHLDNANFSHSVFESVNFSGSSLRDADFSHASFKSVIFNDADLCGAKMPDATIGACQGNKPVTNMFKNNPHYMNNANSQSMSPIKLRIAVPNTLFAELNNGIPRGVIIELLDAVLKRNNYQPSYITMSSTAKTALLKGDIDINLAVLVPNKQTDQVSYSPAIIREYNVILKNRSNPLVLESITDLNQLKVGIRTGFDYPILKKQHDIELIEHESDGENILGLLLGDLDLVAIGSVSDIYEFSAEGVMGNFIPLNKAVGYVDLGIAYSHKKLSNTQITLLNKEIQRIMKSEQWLLILEKNGLSDLISPWPLVKH